MKNQTDEMANASIVVPQEFSYVDDIYDAIMPLNKKGSGAV